jgi:hypothetical protein
LLYPRLGSTRKKCGKMIESNTSMNIENMNDRKIVAVAFVVDVTDKVDSDLGNITSQASQEISDLIFRRAECQILELLMLSYKIENEISRNAYVKSLENDLKMVRDASLSATYRIL